MKRIIKPGLLTASVLLMALSFSAYGLLSCTGSIRENKDAALKSSGKPLIEYAKRLEIVRFNGYSQVNIVDPWQGAAGITMTWYLVPQGSDPPEEIKSSSLIRVPVMKIICMSTTHVAMISALGEAESLAGMSGTGFVYDEIIRERINKGVVHEVGYEDNLNKERIIAISPDLIMVYGVGSESSGYTGKLRELGMKIIFNADHLETDPLGKAEWIKLFGALYGKETLADSLFTNICEQYRNLRNLIRLNSDDSPEVLLGLPFRDTWYVSPGNSYISRLIEDAGGSYVWRNTYSEVSMPYGIENVYLKALNADFWLNPGSAVRMEEISSVDPRLAGLPSFINGQVFNNNRRISAGGGNDYWESGCLNPHIILEDIASILHPEIFADHELVYYKKVE